MKTRFKTFAMIAALCTQSVLGTAPAKAGSEAFVGEMMLFAGTFCPRGWAKADGQLLAISQNDALFSLYGTIYGGDGRTTFGLPDLRGRGPIHQGTGPGLPTYRIGAKGGIESTALNVTHLAPHNHSVRATNQQGNKFGPGTDFLADPNTNDPSTEVKIYSDAPINRQMSPNMIQNTGFGQAFNTESGYLGIQWCVSLFGIYPSRN